MHVLIATLFFYKVVCHRSHIEFMVTSIFDEQLINFVSLKSKKTLYCAINYSTYMQKVANVGNVTYFVVQN